MENFFPWFFNQLEPNGLFLNVPIFWWGRIGKFLQLISITSVIIDLVGEKEIKIYAKSLVKDLAKTKRITAYFENKGSKINLIICLILTCLLLGKDFLSYLISPAFPLVILVVVALFFSLVYSVSIICTILFMISIAFVSYFSRIFIYPVVKILEGHADDDIGIKYFCLSLFLIGFCLDMLSA